MSHCPWCHAPNKRSTGYDSAPPVAGDVSICWTCRQVGMYTEHGDIRTPTKSEYEAIVSDPEVRRVIALTHSSPTPASAIDIWRSL